tara:strand:+ start:2347 stop:3012 length:666 start_codon:yes stop_codon:yes gene_type:complete
LLKNYQKIEKFQKKIFIIIVLELRMKIKKIILILSLIILSACVGYSSTGVLGTGVSIALDPRSLGTQIDDSIMQQNLRAKLVSSDKSYIISVKTKILDGRIFLTGKVNSVEDKLKITKLAWEVKGARSVNNDLQIKEKFDFKRSAKDLLITSQLRTALIGSKKIKSVNYNIDTYKKKIYIYGIAQTKLERDEVVKEAKQILDVEDVITSIFLVDDLRVVKK